MCTLGIQFQAENKLKLIEFDECSFAATLCAIISLDTVNIVVVNVNFLLFLSTVINSSDEATAVFHQYKFGNDDKSYSSDHTMFLFSVQHTDRYIMCNPVINMLFMLNISKL